MSRGKSLQDVHRAFIVRELACFARPKQAADALKEQFGIEASPQAMERYDPGKIAGKALAKKWRDLFEATRKAFLEHVEHSVPAANKAVRVAKLSRAADSLEMRGNLVGMKEMLEAVAKEMGNVHTNRREISGRDGKPIQFENLTDEQLDAQLERLLTAMGPMHADDEDAADDGRRSTRH